MPVWVGVSDSLCSLLFPKRRKHFKSRTMRSGLVRKKEGILFKTRKAHNTKMERKERSLHRYNIIINNRYVKKKKYVSIFFFKLNGEDLQQELEDSLLPLFPRLCWLSV